MNRDEAAAGVMCALVLAASVGVALLAVHDAPRFPPPAPVPAGCPDLTPPLSRLCITGGHP